MKKIPDNAKCVFRGVIYDVYQWEQEMFDGSFSTFECLKRPDTAIVLAFDKDNNIYYGKQIQPSYDKHYFSLFGGRADEGETALEAAKRELKEETGMESDSWTLFKTFGVPGKIDWNICYFIANNCEKTTDPILDSGGEEIEIMKTSFDDFINNVMTDSIFKEFELKTMLSDFTKDKKNEFKEKILNIIKE